MPVRAVQDSNTGKAEADTVLASAGGFKLELRRTSRLNRGAACQCEGVHRERTY